MTGLLDTPCSIIHRADSGTTGDYGDVVYTPTETNTVCSLQQTQRTEPPTEGELSITTWALYLPPGTSVDTGDAVRVTGEVYEVIGTPWDAAEGSAAVHHMEATVKRSAGAEDA